MKKTFFSNCVQAITLYIQWVLELRGFELRGFELRGFEQHGVLERSKKFCGTRFSTVSPQATRFYNRAAQGKSCCSKPLYMIWVTRILSYTDFPQNQKSCSSRTHCIYYICTYKISVWQYKLQLWQNKLNANNCYYVYYIWFMAWLSCCCT